MPELPELEVICEVLRRRIVNQTIVDAEVLPPGGLIIVRDLTHSGFKASLKGAIISAVKRRGKFLIFSLQNKEPQLFLVINPKLTGRLQLADPEAKRRPKTHVVFLFSGGRQMRYMDQRQMGQIYLTHNPEDVPDFAGMGPEPFDLTFEEFKSRLKSYRGEIKGVLTRGAFVAGIGNAYSDEILWAAGLYPFLKNSQLKPEQVERLYAAMNSTLKEAIDKVREEMQENIDQKPRDFLAVHMKTVCPRCHTPVSLVGSNQKITNFCRVCQPGGLIKGM